MKHQVVLDQWAELLKMIESTRPTTDNADAQACLDAIKQMAEGQSALIAEAAEAAKK